MSQVETEMLEVIREALDLEMSAKRFYEHAASVTENEHGQMMFQRLAREEDDHMDAVGAIFESITGSDEWKEIARQEMQRAAPSPIVERLKAAVAERGGEERADDAEALRMAMDLERRAIRFFEELARKSRDPKIHELASKVADEEKFHYDMLQIQHDSVINTGFWLDDAEFRMDSKY